MYFYYFYVWPFSYNVWLNITLVWQFVWTSEFSYCMHLCVCVWMYIYIIVYACMYAYVCVYIIMYACIYACVHVYVCVHTGGHDAQPPSGDPPGPWPIGHANRATRVSRTGVLSWSIHALRKICRNTKPTKVHHRVIKQALCSMRSWKPEWAAGMFSL